MTLAGLRFFYLIFFLNQKSLFTTLCRVWRTPLSPSFKAIWSPRFSAATYHDAVQLLTYSPAVKQPPPKSHRESHYAPAQKSAWWQEVTWCPCSEKRTKARGHLMSLCRKAREDKELITLFKKLYYIFSCDNTEEATIIFQPCLNPLGHGVHQGFTGCHWSPLPLLHDDDITEAGGC